MFTPGVCGGVALYEPVLLKITEWGPVELKPFSWVAGTNFGSCLAQIRSYTGRAVARKKLQPRRTHGPLYEISRMKSSNIISLIKK